MSIFLSVHDIAGIEASAYSMPMAETVAPQARLHCQTLVFRNASQHLLARITLFFDDPRQALPVGDRTQLDAMTSPASLPAIAVPDPPEAAAPMITLSKDLLPESWR